MIEKNIVKNLKTKKGRRSQKEWGPDLGTIWEMKEVARKRGTSIKKNVAKKRVLGGVGKGESVCKREDLDSKKLMTERGCRKGGSKTYDPGQDRKGGA